MDDDDAAALALGLRIGVRGVCIGGLQARLLLPEEQAARGGHQRLRGCAGAVPRLPSHHGRDIAQSSGGTEDRIMIAGAVSLHDSILSTSPCPLVNCCSCCD